MSLRLKIVLALVLLSASATAAVGFGSYVSTRHELNEVVDTSLTGAVRRLAGRPFGCFDGRGPGLDGDGDIDNDGRPGPGGPVQRFDQVLFQVIDANGAVICPAAQLQLPVDEADIAVAAGGPAMTEPRDAVIDGEPFRVLTVPTVNGALQLARSSQETQRAVDVIRGRAIGAVIVVSLGAALLGWLIGRQVTRRLRRLTEAADAVADTGRLDVEVPVGGTDETGRLGAAFSGMLGALAQSREQQQQLVQDAGHELRTPLTSLRTNVAVLRRFESLPPEARQQLIADLDSETKELSSLVNELVELATDRRDDEALQVCDLGGMVEQAAARVRRRTGRDVVVVSDTSDVMCRPVAMDRAIHNVIDNAAKFSTDGAVEVEVAAGRVTVGDRGLGIPEADLPHIFDRFYRSVASRSQPGSGLGLAIVKDIVQSHGGSVFAEARPGGGAMVGFQLPVAPPGRRASP